MTAIIITAIVVAGVVAITYKFGCKHKWVEQKCLVMQRSHESHTFYGQGRVNTVVYNRHQLCCAHCGKIKFVDEPHPEFN